jgi:hypothetical protein
VLYIKNLLAQRHRVWKIYRGLGFLAVVKGKQLAAEREGEGQEIKNFTTARKLALYKSFNPLCNKDYTWLTSLCETPLLPSEQR